MHNISRRNFVLSATAASAGFGLTGPLEFIGSAQAQNYANAKLLDKGFHKFKSGDVESPKYTTASGIERWKTGL